MEISLLNTNFAFYFSSQSVYLTGEVLDFSIQNCPNLHIKHFQTVKKGLKLNLKYTGDDCRQVLEILTNRIVKLHVISVEIPQDTRFKEKFIFDEVSACGYLEERS